MTVKIGFYNCTNNSDIEIDGASVEVVNRDTIKLDSKILIRFDADIAIVDGKMYDWGWD